jgi:hypothetical protein
VSDPAPIAQAANCMLRWISSSIAWSGSAGNDATGERRVAAIAASTSRPRIAGVWHPAIAVGWRLATRSTARWNLASSTSASQGLM